MWLKNSTWLCITKKKNLFQVTVFMKAKIFHLLFIKERRKPGETGATSVTALLCLTRSDERAEQATGSSALSRGAEAHSFLL